MFNWVVEKDRVTVSPVVGMEPFTKEQSRDRVLTDNELRMFWATCDEIGWPFGPFFQLLLLTGQRRDEVARLAWSEVDLVNRVWTLPSHRAKTDGYIKCICSTRRSTSFGHCFASAMASYSPQLVRQPSLASLELNVRLILRCKENRHSNRNTPSCGRHDCRTQATQPWGRLGFCTIFEGQLQPDWRLGYPPHVVDKILNHVSGTIRGVAAIYNRFEYLEERADALRGRGAHLDSVTRQPERHLELSA